jgi:hypothetical protein
MSAEVYVLHDGRSKMPMARVVPDDRWPGMWRIAWSDGRLSDMTNLTRCKDAAAVFCARDLPSKDRRDLRWRIEGAMPGAGRRAHAFNLVAAPRGPKTGKTAAVRADVGASR